MTNKKGYIIIPDKKLIIEYYQGEFHSVDLKGLIGFKDSICGDENYNPNYNIIDDFRDAEFLFKIEEISGYIKFISEGRKNYGIRRTAIITSTPNQVVTSVGFDILKKDLPISVKVASTLESAVAFVGLSVTDIDFVEACIEKLKETD